ncbi:TetR/AcrR family transcriptional regulator [Pontiellaceae bacterium B12219]|nr:TetR/AcrR family transcriptional regulator [Pontiellaceae bacterium B12219]
MKEIGTYKTAEERKVQTVETVLNLATHQSPEAITTTAIAKKMGLSQAAIFRHFPKKEAIFEAVMEWVAEQLLSRLDRATKAASSPLAVLEAMFLEHVDFVIEYPGVPRMLFGELQRGEKTATKDMVQILLHRYGKRVHRLLEEGKAYGEIDEVTDTDAATTLFIGTLQGLIIQSILVGDVGRMRSDAPKVFTIYRRGLGGIQ